MNRILLNRRLDCVNYALSGLRSIDWIKQIALQYHKTEACIWVDWGRRKVWLPQILQLTCGAYRIAECIHSLELARGITTSLMQTSTSEAVRVAAAGKVATINKTLFEISAHTGIIPTVLTEMMERIDEIEKLVNKK